MSEPKNGGPAFPTLDDHEYWHGMFLREYLACHLHLTQPDLLLQFSEADDQDLLQSYGTPEEQEEGFQFVGRNQPTPVASIELRQKLEARGRARLRVIEADALLAELEKGGAA